MNTKIQAILQPMSPCQQQLLFPVGFTGINLVDVRK